MKVNPSAPGGGVGRCGGYEPPVEGQIYTLSAIKVNLYSSYRNAWSGKKKKRLMEKLSLQGEPCVMTETAH